VAERVLPSMSTYSNGEVLVSASSNRSVDNGATAGSVALGVGLVAWAVG
jgi:hypothetical protein